MSAQDFERDWWGDCANTYGEETKQLVYARHMKIELLRQGGPGPVIDLAGKSVADLGGGPVSLLLKTTNADRRIVVDPCAYPDWVASRYQHAGILYQRIAAERWLSSGWDEVWIYNCLTHVEDPEQCVATARRSAALIRLFEWLEIPEHEGHPHMLHAKDLDRWLGSFGSVGQIDERGATGLAYWGVFAT